MAELKNSHFRPAVGNGPTMCMSADEITEGNCSHARSVSLFLSHIQHAHTPHALSLLYFLRIPWVYQILSIPISARDTTHT